MATVEEQAAKSMEEMRAIDPKAHILLIVAVEDEKKEGHSIRTLVSDQSMMEFFMRVVFDMYKEERDAHSTNRTEH